MTTTSIRVNYKLADGWHVFESDDLPGLYVASQDARTAYEDLPRAIQMLLQLDLGIDCAVQPEMSFQEFVRSSRGDAIQQDDAPVVMSNRRFALACAA